MKKIYYRKLIRDKIPERAAESGAKASYRALPKRMFIRELMNKAGEEIDELRDAKGKKELINELGDVLDVLDEIKIVYKVTSKEIAQARQKSMKRKGGFKKRLYLVWATEHGYKKSKNKK